MAAGSSSKSCVGLNAITREVKGCHAHAKHEIGNIFKCFCFSELLFFFEDGFVELGVELKRKKKHAVSHGSTQNKTKHSKEVSRKKDAWVSGIVKQNVMVLLRTREHTFATSLRNRGSIYS